MKAGNKIRVCRYDRVVGTASPLSKGCPGGKFISYAIRQEVFNTT